jgi:hypothetical protein
MRSVALQYHYIDGHTDEQRHPFPAEDICDFFHWARVELRIRKGNALKIRFLGSHSKLIEKCRSESDRAGHVVMGLSYTGAVTDPTSISGEMIDLATRGAAIIYTGSYRFKSGQPALMTQTIVHEIGHLFNLGHEQTGYPTAMHPPDMRIGLIADAWARMQQEARAIRGDAYRADDPAKLDCFPLSYSARKRLNDMGEEELLPWRGKFNPPADEATA